MVIDSSAVIAILFKEPEAIPFETAILDDPLRYISAASWVESAIVLHRHSGDRAIHDLDDLIRRMKIEIIPVTVQQAEVARGSFTCTARAVTRLRSILAIVSLMRWRKFRASRCCVRETISE